MLSSLYRLLTNLGAPAIGYYLRRRLAAGREDVARFDERLGYPSQPRPEGLLIWCHAASVGEAVSLLALITRLRVTYPHYPILVTTGTVTSARMLEKLLPSQVIHHYMPVDRMPYVKRFLNHWQPNFIIWVESELWPNMLSAVRKRQIPAVLLNGRMSDQSFRHWSHVKGWSQHILSTFNLCLTQSEKDKQRFIELGARAADCVGNLKYAARPLPYDEEKLQTLQKTVGERPLWLMASTHRGEERMAIAAHKYLAQIYPDLLTIIVPRHAIRGKEVADILHENNLPFAQRSQKQFITPQTAVYLADTMGELGLFYRLAPIVAMGGSFMAIGGHNPIEPAQLGATIVLGPHMYNFAAITQEFTDHKAALVLQNAEELPGVLANLFAAPDICKTYAEAARHLSGEKHQVIDRVLERIAPWLQDRPRAIA